MLACLDGDSTPQAAYAPPVLRDGEVLIGQTTNILLYLGRRLGLAPRAESGRLWLNQLQLTMADWLTEVHDTHHPLSMNQYYEEQKQAAMLRSADFRGTRLPKFLDYFTQVLLNNGSRGQYLVGARLTYGDLSLFQMLAGLRYAFPQAMARLAPEYPPCPTCTMPWRRGRTLPATCGRSAESRSMRTASSAITPNWTDKKNSRRKGRLSCGCHVAVTARW